MNDNAIIKVIAVGAAGKMGLAVCEAVINDSQLKLVGTVDRAGLSVPWLEEHGLQIKTDLKEVLSETRADVIVDFTRADVVMSNAEIALEAGAHAVIGTTGMSSDEMDALSLLTKVTGKNIIVAPNFALGAVIMMKMSEKISGYFDRAEIIEYHHDEKHDAPSGTSILTAEMIAKNLQAEPLTEVEKFTGARGATVEGIPVHSVRLPGYVAHQEVSFGLKGQVLSIRHDSIDRSSFMPGVVMAVKEIASRPGFTYGLDKLLEI